jgi:hypothetical protein
VFESAALNASVRADHMTERNPETAQASNAANERRSIVGARHTANQQQAVNT